MQVKKMAMIFLFTSLIVSACRKLEEEKRTVYLRIKNEDSIATNVRFYAMLGHINTPSDSLILNIQPGYVIEQTWTPKKIGSVNEGGIEMRVNKSLYIPFYYYGSRFTNNSISCTVLKDTVIY